PRCAWAGRPRRLAGGMVGAADMAAATPLARRRLPRGPRALDADGLAALGREHACHTPRAAAATRIRHAPSPPRTRVRLRRAAVLYTLPLLRIRIPVFATLRLGPTVGLP